MPAVLISSQASPATAALGNTNPAIVTVSVLSTDGVVGTGLLIGDFTVYTKLVGAGGFNVEISSVIEASSPGFYNVHLIPVSGNTWQDGTYVVGIKVQRASTVGLTVATFEVPS